MVSIRLVFPKGISARRLDATKHTPTHFRASGTTEATDQKHVSVKARVPQFPMFNLCFEAHISTLFKKG